MAGGVTEHVTRREERGERACLMKENDTTENYVNRIMPPCTLPVVLSVVLSCMSAALVLLSLLPSISQTKVYPGSASPAPFK